MGEQLRGAQIAYLRKPSPNFLGVGTILEEEEVRKHFRRTARAASGCSLELIQRDVYTINHDVGKVKRYVATHPGGHGRMLSAVRQRGSYGFPVGLKI